MVSDTVVKLGEQLLGYEITWEEALYLIQILQTRVRSRYK